MNRKAFIDKLAAQLKVWDAEIQKLEARKDKAQAETRAEYSKQIQELRDKKKTAQGRLEELKQAGDDAWADLKSGTEKAFDEMKNAFESALTRFR